MCPTNDFLPFATGGSPNIETQVNYAADPLRGTGNVPGVAISAFNNKAIRQACWIASVLAQFIVNSSGNDVLDDGNSATLLASMALTWPSGVAPTLTRFSSTGTTAGRLFIVTAANATAAATYTNNGNTYTVLNTISSGTRLFTSGAAAPTSSGTLTKASGTGDATITFSVAYALAAFTTTAGVKYIKVKGVAGGGGGGGSGDTAPTAGTAGEPTAFGPDIVAINGGGGGTGTNPAAGTGGTAGQGTNALRYPGLPGGSGSTAALAGMLSGCGGGTSFFGGGAAPGNFVYSSGQNRAGVDGLANSGAGGSAGATVTSTNVGSGGGGGESFSVILASGTYYYHIGSGGAAGAAGGAGGQNGGAGAAGCIEIEQYFI